MIKSRPRLLTAAAALLILSLTFTLLLRFTALHIQYRNSLVSSYASAAGAIKQRIESAGSIGNDMRHPADPEQILLRAKELIQKKTAGENSISVSLAFPDGRIIHSSNSLMRDTRIPEPAVFAETGSTGKPDSQFQTIRSGSSYHVILPLHMRENRKNALIVISFDEKELHSLQTRIMLEETKTLFCIFAIMILAVCCLLIGKMMRHNTVAVKKQILILFLLIGISQILFFTRGIIGYKTYREGVRRNQAEIFALLSKEERDSLPAVSSRSSSFLSETNTKSEKDAVSDSLTALLICLLFSLEMLIFTFCFTEKRDAGPENGPAVPYGFIRPAAFLFFFGMDICISFLPLHTETLYEPLFGLPEQVVTGLPISVKTCCAALSFLIAGIWADRSGWYPPFFCGLFLSAAGLFYARVAPDAFHFILSCGLIGLGYGLYVMAAQSFLIFCTDENSKSQGFACFFAGIYAGSICGGATGAMLAENLGYRPVFFIGALILFSIIPYSLFFMRDAFRTDHRGEVHPSAHQVSLKQFFVFLSDRNVLSIFLFCSIPANMAMMGFIDYFSPVYLNRIGRSQSDIGRILMLYGFCIIFIGPVISRYADASENKKLYAAASGIVGSLGCIIFYFKGGLGIFIIAILLLGISQSFAFFSQNTYVLNLKAGRALGAGKSIAVFRSASRLGQISGPILIGWLIAVSGIQKGIAWFGCIYLFCIVLFLLLSKKE